MMVIESIEFSPTKYPLEKGTFDPGVVYLIKDKTFLNSCRNDLWSLIQASYAKAGGYKGHDNPRKLIKSADCAKIVFSEEGKVRAFALYSNRLGGNKRFCSAKDPSDDAAFVRIIASDDIKDLDGYYWVEASGGIEHIFKQEGGNPIPNEFAAEFLKMEESKLTLHSDGLHYSREVGLEHEVLTKMIFGFKDEATAKRVCKKVADYEAFKLNANKIVKLYNEADADQVKSEEWACAVANQLHDLRYECNCNELFPHWKKALEKAKKILQDAIDLKDDLKLRSCLNIVNDCLTEMPVLVLHQFHIS